LIGGITKLRTGRRILKNLFSLSIAEVANKGILFISTIYLARTILPDGFGVISFANSILVFFSLVVNLGFNIVGSREIAKDHSKISLYAGQITSVRLLLAVFSSAVLIALALLLDKPPVTKLVIIISSINLFSQAFLMDWVYQGNEKMEFLALRQVITSMLSLIGLLLFVHNPGDVVLAMIITVSSILINSLWMFGLYAKMYGRIKLGIDKVFLRNLLKSSIPITFSTFFILIFNYMNIVMLGFLRSDAETGFYSAAFKFVVLVLTPSAIIQNAFFPVLSRSENIEDRQKKIRIYGNFIFIIGAVVSLLIMFFPDYFIVLVYGSSYAASIPVLQVLMVTVTIMYLNTIYYPPLVSWKYEKTVMYAIGTGGVVNIILNFILIPQFGATGAAWSTVFSELSVLTGLIFITKRIIKKVFILSKIQILAIALVAAGAGFSLHYYLNLNVILSALIILLIYFPLILLFKIVTVSEIKGYLSK
jgi:O-antigen/teichoic acid export membrane protein